MAPCDLGHLFTAPGPQHGPILRNEGTDCRIWTWGRDIVLEGCRRLLMGWMQALQARSAIVLSSMCWSEWRHSNQNAHTNDPREERLTVAQVQGFSPRSADSRAETSRQRGPAAGKQRRGEGTREEADPFRDPPVTCFLQLGPTLSSPCSPATDG